MTVAVSALACAVAAWLVRDGDSRVLRWLVVAAAAAAVAGAVLLRKQDRTASLRIKEAVGARTTAELHQEEAVAELEAQLDEARELRRALEERLSLRAGELQRMRSEHAALLRRYATAETERAGALESRRLLAIEAREAPLALPAASGDRLASGAPTPATYLRASVALRHLAANAARQGRGGEHERAGESFDYFGRAAGEEEPAARTQTVTPRPAQPWAAEPETSEYAGVPGPRAKALPEKPEPKVLEPAGKTAEASKPEAETSEAETPEAEAPEPEADAEEIVDAELVEPEPEAPSGGDDEPPADGAGAELPAQPRPEDRRPKGAISRVIDLAAS
ncbi:hypothetical protein SRB5_48540 [Streptomyces sp. RB5]|uniref:Secreted protein n=1 Tax=Streptomyces smaragdinus TaxID=2585196 RepID=A0A7K0CMH2_9ACTN|nr:hypothetical protein [Streptomyces smaragdinus]MQY14678.1 hypothetical protein [Streptomyces smaragdinus]